MPPNAKSKFSDWSKGILAADLRTRQDVLDGAK